MKLWMMFALLAHSFVCFSQDKIDKVIYGDDNRVEVLNSPDRLWAELANSTAIQMDPPGLNPHGGMVPVVAATLKEAMNVCDNEPFADQPSPGRCSGFLVGPDKLVTAGHCITNDADCKEYVWLFDYRTDENGKAPDTVPEKNFYHCKRIISRAQSIFTKNDYAYIELDRVVEGREPLQVRKSGKIANNTELVVIGHPSGLPTKIAGGAVVRKNSNSYYFVTNTDTYGGNSGSAVFDAKTGQVEGILVRGDTDFVDGPGGCMVSNRCANTGCRGEDVTRITVIRGLAK
jgi:hypothetical protein